MDKWGAHAKMEDGVDWRGSVVNIWREACWAKGEGESHDGMRKGNSVGKVSLNLAPNFRIGTTKEARVKMRSFYPLYDCWRGSVGSIG